MIKMLSLTTQELNTVLAALRFYQAGGQGEPANRSDDIHAIACGDAEGMSEETSLDDAAIDELALKLNAPQDKPVLQLALESVTLDDALRLLMERLDITDGGVAAVTFSGYDDEGNTGWHHGNQAVRREMLVEWFNNELVWAPEDEEEDDMPETDPENIYGLPGIRQSIEEDRK